MHSDYLLDTIPMPDGRIEIGYESDPENPREWDNLGTMVCKHSRYNLGDHIPDERIESFDALTRYYAGTSGVFLPLYLLDHSGLALRTYRGSEYMGWDTSLLGIIYVTKAEIVADYGDDSPESRARALDVLAGEVKTYGAYVDGEVYEWAIYDAEGEMVNGCGGYYDYDACYRAAEDDYYRNED